MDDILKKVETSKTQTLCYLIEVSVDDKNNLSKAAPEIKQFHFCSNLLNMLSQENALKLLKKMKYKFYKGGERLITQGEKGDTFYLILNGKCSITIEKNNMFYNIGQLDQGDIAGESILFEDQTYEYNVEADGDVDSLLMSKKDYFDLTSENSEFRNLLSSIITHRISNPRLDSERKIGKYSVIEKIEQGGASIIYKGIHSVLKMPVAIKMLRHELSMDDDFLERFRNEAKIIARLNHPNIMRIYDIEELYQTIFIIMEYLEGMPLKSMISTKRKMTIEQVTNIVTQVCKGLEYAHKQGIIHQDINPRNIFIQPNGIVKIIDFGLAIKRGSIDNDFLFPGTIYYISPEQLKGEPVDERSDLYSLGITLYEMLMGKKPFASCHTKAIVDWHLNKDFTDISETLKDIPEELFNFLSKTIRKNPEERFKNAAEALKELEILNKRLGLSTETKACIQNKLIGMFLVYRDDQQIEVKRLIEDFNKTLDDKGISLKITQEEVL